MSTTAHTVVSVRVYVTVFVSLMLFTGLTVLAGYQDFGFFNTFIALSIAVTKATLVVLFFMGVRHNTPLTKTVVIAGFCWLFILFGLGMSDYLTRSWIGVPGERSETDRLRIDLSIYLRAPATVSRVRVRLGRHLPSASSVLT